MFGFLNMTPEILERWADRDRERERRVAVLIAAGRSSSDARLIATCDMEWEERDAIQQAKLADIRENGT